MAVQVLEMPKEEQAEPRYFEAVDLDGDLPVHPVLSLLSDEELEHGSHEAHVNAEGSLLLRCDFLVEHVRRAGSSRTARAQALAQFRQATGLSAWLVYQMLAVGRYWTYERRELYPTLTFEVLAETVRHTRRDGDTPRTREERIARVAKEAADADLNASKTKDLARSIDRPERQPGSHLELDAPHPATVAETPPEQQAELCVEDMIPILTRGLEKRFRDDNPGTPKMMVAVVVDHLHILLPDLPWTVTVTA